MSASALKAMHQDYRLGASKPRRAKRDDPEHRLQCAVVRELEQLERLGLLHVFNWTSSLAGVRLTVGVRAKAKKSGLRTGWPDLQFACWDGVTRYIELKVDAGLSSDQRLFRDYAQPLGVWALAHSVGEVIDALRTWDLVKARAAA